VVIILLEKREKVLGRLWAGLVSGVWVLVLFVAVFGVVLNVPLARGSGTIYIRADGSIEPPTAPISTVDNVTYTLTDNVYDSIVVERDNIVVYGASHIVQGTGIWGGGTGVYLAGRSNVTIKNVKIEVFYYSIRLVYSSNINISENNITNNGYGIWFSSSNYNKISGNDITTNNWGGIYFDNSSNNVISGNNITAMSDGKGIELTDSSNNMISGNNVTNNWLGIFLERSPNNVLRNNSMAGNRFNFGVDYYEPSELLHFTQDVDSSNTVDGKSVYYWVNRQNLGVPSDAGYVVLVNCYNITVESSELNNNWPGILLANTTDSNVINNKISNNERGVFLYLSSNNTISSNNFTNNGIGIYLDSSSNNRLFGNNITTTASGVYSIALRNSSNCNTISHNTISGDITWAHMGVGIDGSFNNTVSENNITGHVQHIQLWDSSNNIISGNNMAHSGWDGVLVGLSSYNAISGNNMTAIGYRAIVVYSSSSNNSVSGNNITNSGAGIVLYSTSSNTISGNNLTDNWGGIELYESSNNNSINGNNIASNSGYGIHLDYSSNNVISGNMMNGNVYFSVFGVELSHYMHSIDASNLVNGKPVCYLVNQKDLVIDPATHPQIGYLALVNCTNVTVEGLTLTKSSEGLLIAYTNNSKIQNNNITNNRYGIYLVSSINNIINANNITSNEWNGIRLIASSNNRIYHNSFIDNTQYQESGYVNVWDNGYSSGGNYWNSYAGIDKKSGPDQDQPGSDGIGDTPYVIDSYNKDRYPLMAPWPSGPGLHELEVTLKAPTRIRPGDSTILEAILTNKGFYDEENMMFSLFVNNRIVNSTTISMLKADSSYTINYLWTPTIEGRVNVTACATPVPGETYVANNQETMFVTVIPPTVRNINTGFDYFTIQEAIDAPETLSGHTIKVDAGTYYENVAVYKSISLIGENRSTTIIDGNRTGTVVYVTANNVIIQNFTIQNSGTYGPYSGIRLRYVQNCKITDNNVINNWAGIWLEYSSNNLIYHNNFINNTAAQAAVSLGYVNTWDDGYRSGGNYWSNYAGADSYSGPYQNEAGSDGIGDTPHVLDANNRDRYPLMRPWPSEPSLHELQVTLKAPIRLPPGDSTLLEATVWNYGFSDEQNVTFYLLVNGTVVNSTTISLLEADSSYTINYLWVPIIEGRVNVTAYATPVPSEIYVANNRKTAFVTISSKPPIQNINTGLYYNTIQEAIDASETFDGHTIKVEAGTYYEHVTISKSLRIIGEDRTYTIIDGSKTGTFVVSITANNVVLSGFTIQNSNTAPTPAIQIYSSNNVISNNIIINNGWGVYSFNVQNNTIENNIITNNVYGINLEWVTTHTVRNNTITNQQQAGIYLRESRNNIFTNNTIKNNKDGIVLISYSNYNKFYHNNIIDNTSQGFTVNSDTNTWDNGYPSGGNYWSNYAGVDVKSGSNQDQPGSDGIGDTAHTFSGSNIDNYPLMNPIGSPQPPIAIFTYAPEHPLKDKTVTFNATSSHDRDGYIASYRWDFGDGNITITTNPIIAHIYTATGTYQVNLTVTDNDGLTHSTAKSITAIEDFTPPTTIHDYDSLWHTSDFTITLTATDDLSGVAETYYRINDGPIQNVSAHGHSLITTEGADNKLEYWSVDNAGNEELPHKILTGIKLDKTYPTIDTLSRTPDGDVLPDQSVKVSVNVTDATSNVKNVTLSYTINDGETWTDLQMNNTVSNLYEATIPPQQADTTVRFSIIAYDYAGNNATLDGTQPYCVYQVIPEFPSSLILPIFMIITLLAATAYKRKHLPL
jgi:parallel beta-helix repeat protein